MSETVQSPQTCHRPAAQTGSSVDLSPDATAAPSPTRLASAAGRPRRILVIEDNVDAAQLLADVLEMGGHSVRIAHDGREGVALAREMEPELIFCDLGLPLLDGFGVARAVRSDDRLRSTVLVAVSGYSRPQDRLRSADAGFDFHLAKPATVVELESLVASLP